MLGNAEACKLTLVMKTIASDRAEKICYDKCSETTDFRVMADNKQSQRKPKIPSNMTELSAYIPRELKIRFRQECIALEKSISAVITRMIMNWVDYQERIRLFKSEEKRAYFFSAEDGSTIVVDRASIEKISQEAIALLLQESSQEVDKLLPPYTGASDREFLRNKVLELAVDRIYILDKETQTKQDKTLYKKLSEVLRSSEQEKEV